MIRSQRKHYFFYIKIFLVGILLFFIPLFFLGAAELPRILNITLGNITKNSAVVRWESNHFQYVCTVYYGETPTSFENRISGSLVGSGIISPKKDFFIPYEVTLNNLSSNQFYFYKVVCTSSDGGSAESGILSFSTLGESLLSIDKLSISSITDQSALVTWEVNQSPAECEILYGTSMDALTERFQGELLNNSYWRAGLSGLLSNTKYFYKVACSSNGSSVGTTSMQEFTTQDIVLEISNITETNIHSTDGVVRWDTNSPNQDCSLLYGIGSFENRVSGSLVHYGDTSRGDKSTFEAILSRLLPDTVYSYVISCSGKSNVLTKSSVYRFSTLSDSDSLSTSSSSVQITTLRAYNITETAATINWDAGSPLYSCVLIYGDTPNFSGSALGRLVQYATTSNDGRNVYESQIKGLKSATKYYYKVDCSLGIGFSGESETKDFITLKNISENNETHEISAKEIFQKIYLHEPKVSDRFDQNALSIIAYGIKQRPENRSLSKERHALTIYGAIFHSLPSLSSEWNILHAIAYSGAKR